MPLVAAVTFAALTGCDSADDGADNGATDPTAPTASTAAVSVSSEQDNVVASYKEFWVRLRNVEDEAKKDWKHYLGEVAVDPQLRISFQATRFQKRNEITLYGEIAHRVTEVDINGASATVEDCQDASRTGQADAETGKRKTVGVERDPVRGTLERVAGGQWKVSKITFLDGEC